MLLGFVLVVLLFSLAVPGIVLNKRKTIMAIVESIRLVRHNLLPTMNLLLFVLLIGSGMNFLWRLADNGSWLTLASIAGHGFVSTALAVAIFVFYRDRHAATILVKQSEGADQLPD
jgi:hypothetical protein